MINYTSTNIRTWSRLGSCGAFGIAVLELAELDKRITAITSDLTYYSGLERFKSRFPERFFNVGIAEQNMVAVAAGIAKEGLIPFATTYATFACARACDQVRVNMGYMKLGVKLVGLTAGLSVGILGSTHISIEDIAVMRAIPNLMILSPADCMSTIKATIAASECSNPVYLRLTGQMSNPIVYSENYDFKIGKANILKKGQDITIIATGTMVYQSMLAAKILEDLNLNCTVIDMHTIKPIDREVIREACRTKLIVTAEEHNVIGGLGGAVSEVLSSIGHTPPQLFIGIEDTFMKAGDYNYLLEKNCLTSKQIAKKIYNKLKSIS